MGMPVVFAFLRCLLAIFLFLSAWKEEELWQKKLLSLLEKADFAAGLLSQNEGERLRLMETWLEETLRPKNRAQRERLRLALENRERRRGGTP
jgi:hypothetical protein